LTITPLLDYCHYYIIDTLIADLIRHFELMPPAAPAPRRRFHFSQIHYSQPDDIAHTPGQAA